jgi:hypothetical protein
MPTRLAWISTSFPALRQAESYPHLADSRILGGGLICGVLRASETLNGEGHLLWHQSHVIPEQAGGALCARNNVSRPYRGMDKSKQSIRRREECLRLGVLGRERARLYQGRRRCI